MLPTPSPQQPRGFRRGMAKFLTITPPAIHNDDDFPPLETASSADSSRSRNMKKLSLSLSVPSSAASSTDLQPIVTDRPRRPSIVSLPSIATPAPLQLRKDEDAGDDPAAPYTNGPIQILPGIWIGSEENARDWQGLVERGIKSVLNVAKEVASPFDPYPTLRAAASTPDFRQSKHPDPTYCPPHLPSGRPAMYYLKLQWSHGQPDLVEKGFQEGFAFADAALKRGDGCLVQSATMVIALVMRAAAERSSSVPPEIWDLKGMHGAYDFVKDKSPSVGPNMSLIYQLMEYEKKLKGVASRDSDSSSLTDEEEEWGRRRRALDEMPDDEHDDPQSPSFMQQEAKALDKAMEDRIVARKSSASSMSSIGSGLGMGPAWRSRYGRKRTGSVGSSKTNASFISEELVEEDEEQELLGVRNVDSDGESRNDDSPPATSPEDELDNTPRNVLLPAPPTMRLPPSAPAWKTSFSIPPLTAVRSTFELPPAPSPAPALAPAPVQPKTRRRPMSLSILPPVPPSPNNVVILADEPTSLPDPPLPVLSSSLPPPPVRQRTESRRLRPPPLHLRNSVLRKGSGASLDSLAGLSTPSQTLFVFPPSPTLNTRTPSTMTLHTNPSNTPVPFPIMSTPRVATFQSKGRTRSFIGLAAPPTPTVGFSKVDARGYLE